MHIAFAMVFLDNKGKEEEGMIDEEMFLLLDRLGLLGAYLRLANPYERMRQAGLSKDMAEILSAYEKRRRRKEKKKLLKAIQEGKL